MPKSLQDGRGRGWFWMETDLVDAGWVAKLGPTSWAVYSVLARFASDRQLQFPATADLGKLVGVPSAEVRSAYRTLMENQLLYRHRKGVRGASSSYHLGPRGVATPEPPLTPTVVRSKPKPKPLEPAVDFQLQLFEQAWKAYPKRPGNSKQAALLQWKKRRAEGVHGETMLAGAVGYARLVEKAGIQPQYVKMGSTFFGPAGHFEADFVVPDMTPGSLTRQGPADEVASWNENEVVV
jgi:hypothetical protein